MSLYESNDEIEVFVLMLDLQVSVFPASSLGFLVLHLSSFVVGLLAPKGVSRRSCRSRGKRLARVVRRRGRCGSRFFLDLGAFSCHNAFTRAMGRMGPSLSSRGS
jgi:hypothetical protein